MIKQKNIHNLRFTTFCGESLPTFVKDIVEIKGNSAETSQRLYPRNTPEILVNLAEPIVGEIGDKISSVKISTIQGSKTHYADVRHPKFCHFIAIRFTTNGFFKFLGISQKSFTDYYLNLGDVIDWDIDGVVSKLKSTSSAKIRFKKVIKWLKKANNTKLNTTNLLSDFIIEEINQNPSLSIKELVGKTGYTRKHLAECFQEEAGMTIKKYQKIGRINNVLKHIDTQDQISWSKLVFENGFYDQSHFIKDFKRFTGMTPSEYLREKKS